jgi:predicted transcriptional regulator
MKINVSYLGNNKHGYDYEYEIHQNKPLPDIFYNDLKDWIDRVDYFEIEFYIIHILGDHVNMPNK